MKDLKFTPAKWHKSFVVMSDEGLVAKCYGFDRENLEANAQPISMAPDMYEALKQAREVLKKIKSSPCTACGCSADVHADDKTCPEFFNGQIYGWADTKFTIDTSLPEIESALTRINEILG